jgi:8-oxo-dGTP diphosphatase
MARSTYPGGVLVVAALIQRDSQLLIGQRPAGKWNEYKWEFPGGKVEAGESPREALARELDEELDIRAVIGDELTRYQHQYPGRPPIELIFYRVTDFEGEPRNRVFHDLRWETPGRFSDYDFLDGDLDLVRRLVRGDFLG